MSPPVNKAFAGGPGSSSRAGDEFLERAALSRFRILQDAFA